MHYCRNDGDYCEGTLETDLTALSPIPSLLLYRLLSSSADNVSLTEHPSLSHHCIKALQCLSFFSVEESPTTINPDRALVTVS